MRAANNSCENETCEMSQTRSYVKSLARVTALSAHLLVSALVVPLGKNLIPWSKKQLKTINTDAGFHLVVLYGT